MGSELDKAEWSFKAARGDRALTPTLNLHNPKGTFDSKGLTTDDSFAKVLAEIVGADFVSKGEGRRAKREFKIIKLKVIDTNVKDARVGEVYSVFADGNMMYDAGCDSPVTKDSLAAWFKTYEGERVLIKYKGGSKITKGDWKDNMAHTYEVTFPPKAA